MTKNNSFPRTILVSSVMAIGLLGNMASAQSTTSPYSMYGLGNFAPKGDIRASAMGGAGMALTPVSGLGNLNPASSAYLDSMLFFIDFQTKGNSTSYSTKSQTERAFDSSFDNLSFGFKAARWWGTGFGLASMSQTNYEISAQKFLLGEQSKYDVLYEGNGGLSKVYWTNGFRFKNLSLGVNANYVWGNLESKETSTFSLINGETMVNTKTYHLNNLVWDLGLQYHLKLGKNKLSIGATYQPKTTLLTSFTREITGNYTYYTDDRAATDYQLPESFGGGLGLTFGKALTFAADFKLEKWSEAANPVKYASLNDATSLQAGVEYTPQSNQYRNVFNRMMYRAGVYMGDTYLTLQGNTIAQRGFSVGVGIPLHQRRNFINISYQYGITGTQSSGLIKETCQTIKLGLSLSENWFFKSTFD